MMIRNSIALGPEREAFEKNQKCSMEISLPGCSACDGNTHASCIGNSEADAILGSYQDKGARIFWHIAQRLPLMSQPICAWKFCHVLHKLIRDGHPAVANDAVAFKQQLKDLGRNWAHAPHLYGKPIGSYMNTLTQRIDFHYKNRSFAGNLSISEDQFEKNFMNDINSLFELCVQLLDHLDSLIELERQVFSTLDKSRAISLTGPGQCRLSPCILVVLDTSRLYDHLVKILSHLHSCLPADALSGHRKRFEDCFNCLKNFYDACRNLQYFKKLIQIPTLPEVPPDFLVKSSQQFELGPVEIVEEEEEEEEDTEPDYAPPEAFVDDLIDTSPDYSFNDITFMHDGRDDEIMMLRAEIARLKAEIDLLQAEHTQELHHLLAEIRTLQDQFQAAKVAARNGSSEADRLRHIADDIAAKAENASATRNQLSHVEKKAADNEEMYKKLKEKHMDLVKEHAQLLRKNAETKRIAEQIQKSVNNSTDENECLKNELELLKKQLDSYLLSKEQWEIRRLKDLEKLLDAAIKQAYDVIQLAIDSLHDATNARTCTAESLMRIAAKTKKSLDRVDRELVDREKTKCVDGLIQALSSFGHLIARSIDNGAATCNMVSSDQGGALKCACRKCGSASLTFLDSMKQNGSTAAIKQAVEEILNAAKDLLPKMDDRSGDFDDLVEQEMASTSKAVEQAAERIEALLREARSKGSGVNLEVNERILDSCTELMRLIKLLIISAKQLQREIVTQGRGSSTSKEFYMKNSRWTEGLISAAKAVGWGATMLTDSADLVVQGSGKFEELVVWSHEIAASTAQLVAASRVKASSQSGNLTKLESASRNVNSATTKVVSATKARRRQLDGANDFLVDVTNVSSLTQVKRKEMDSQVKLIALEQALQQERVKLGALRKKHYELSEIKDYEDVAKKPTVDRKPNNAPVLVIKPTTTTKPDLPSKPASGKPFLPPKPVL